METPESFMGRDLLEACEKPYALGYFGGKAYYFSSNLDFVATLDEAEPDTAQKEAIANYEIVKNSGALAYCRDKAMQESEIARQAVLTLPDSRYRQGLLDLMTLASQRLY